ncbi:hypothetical protein HY994_04990 [Candidatus Micrarchaeota archaeon]|nr:hypothetical protein [Candidatus Micrarchaeota archaeon]
MPWITQRTEKMRQYRKALSERLPLDERNPYTASDFNSPASTLAGKVADWAYDKLTERPSSQPYTQEQAEKIGGTAVEMFRDTAANSGLGFGRNWQDGKSGFHLNRPSEKPLKRRNDFLFHYRLDPTHRSISGHPNAIRAYVTLHPAVAPRVSTIFIDLVRGLRKAGVEFDAKAAAPDMVKTRLDNLVFYLPDHAENQKKARDVICNYLDEKKVASADAMSAIRGKATGLHWAYEPDQADVAIAQKITGKEKFSHTQLVAAAIAGEYIRRLANAHKARGNIPEAERLQKEAERVDAIL